PRAPLGVSIGSRGATGTGRPPEARRVAARWRRQSRSFGPVLLLIVASIGFAATASDAAWTASVLVLLQSATLVAALWTSGIARAASRLNLVLLFSAVVAAAAELAWSGDLLAGLVGGMSGLLTAAIAVVVASTVVSEPEVNAQSIRGAVCVYLLL